MLPDVATLLARCTHNPATGCWLWQYRIPVVKVNGRNRGVPSVIWQQLHGTRPPRVYRTCRIHRCVAPEHLTLDWMPPRIGALPGTRATTEHDYQRHYEALVATRGPVDWQDTAQRRLRLRLQAAFARIHVTAPELVSVSLEFAEDDVSPSVIDHDRQRTRRRRTGQGPKVRTWQLNASAQATDEQLVDVLLDAFNQAIRDVGLEALVSVRRRTPAEYLRVHPIYCQQEVFTTRMHPVEEKKEDEPEPETFSLSDLRIGWL